MKVPNRRSQFASMPPSVKFFEKCAWWTQWRRRDCQNHSYRSSHEPLTWYCCARGKSMDEEGTSEQARQTEFGDHAEIRRRTWCK